MRAHRDDLSPARSVSGERSRAVSPGLLGETLAGLSIAEEAMEEPEESDGRESLDDEELPDWAKRSLFTNDPLGTSSACFCPAFLF
jgi:hypothetical protein